MKKLLFIVLILTLGSLKSTQVYGQQFLWSTSKDITDVKSIPLTEVKGKVMEYYDTYRYYVDNTGYDVESFNKFIELFDSETKIKKLKDELTKSDTDKLVMCVKGNQNNSSVISVIIMSKKNLDIINFTNGVSNLGIQSTGDNNKNRFEKWFNTLME
jgi:phosphorylcholine metabolism protein LicD